ncbi:uncharacterized protein C8R40DRAFT_1066860 [Lentinula edodes]|uniref:uncharacterized protein n=1 Tax=Lentinula edodes TaxID=5353 RepID=UPI001E8CEA47|nr:uncharacterized protein C8R40DRAFT_1066860 [Lentinula edodes]KAH7878393.1 hypothetical protein C8R40DRAFT_1066860 [Lentinula edodes]
MSDGLPNQHQQPPQLAANFYPQQHPYFAEGTNQGNQMDPVPPQCPMAPQTSQHRQPRDLTYQKELDSARYHMDMGSNYDTCILRPFFDMLDWHDAYIQTAEQAGWNTIATPRPELNGDENLNTSDSHEQVAALKEQISSLQSQLQSLTSDPLLSNESSDKPTLLQRMHIPAEPSLLHRMQPKHAHSHSPSPDSSDKDETRFKKPKLDKSKISFLKKKVGTKSLSPRHKAIAKQVENFGHDINTTVQMVINNPYMPPFPPSLWKQVLLDQPVDFNLILSHALSPFADTYTIDDKGNFTTSKQQLTHEVRTEGQWNRVWRIYADAICAIFTEPDQCDELREYETHIGKLFGSTVHTYIHAACRSIGESRRILFNNTQEFIHLKDMYILSDGAGVISSRPPTA